MSVRGVETKVITLGDVPGGEVEVEVEIESELVGEIVRRHEALRADVCRAGGGEEGKKRLREEGH